MHYTSKRAIKKEELIHSLLEPLAKRDIIVECNHVCSHETSDKLHCSLLLNHKEIQQNTTHEELLLGTSAIVNETDNMNAAIENSNLNAKLEMVISINKIGKKNIIRKR